MTTIEMLTNNAWEDIRSAFSYPVDLQKALGVISYSCERPQEERGEYTKDMP